MTFVSGFRLEISHRKYQIKPHSSPCFLAACAAGIVHRNHLLGLHQQNKTSESKLKFRQAANCCKRILEAFNLAYANKRKESGNLALGAFGELLIVFSTKVNLPYLRCSTAWRCCPLHLIKENCLPKTSLGTLILSTQVSLHLFSLLELM